MRHTAQPGPPPGAGDATLISRPTPRTPDCVAFVIGASAQHAQRIEDIPDHFAADLRELIVELGDACHHNAAQRHSQTASALRNAATAAERLAAAARECADNAEQQARIERGEQR